MLKPPLSLDECLKKDAAWPKLPECNVASPVSGAVCTMGKGHAGPHKVGGPYNTTETFVTKCKMGCDFHHNSNGFYHHRELLREWEECIYCGDKRAVAKEHA